MTEYWTLFFSAFTSATLLPGSSEIVLSALLINSPDKVIPLILIAGFGNLLGSLVNWLLGAYFIHFQDRKWFPVSKSQLARAQNWYNRFGIWSLLLGWLPVIGDPLTLLGGVMRVPLPKFILLVGVGKFARYLFIAGLTLAWFEL